MEPEKNVQRESGKLHLLLLLEDKQAGEDVMGLSLKRGALKNGWFTSGFPLNQPQRSQPPKNTIHPCWGSFRPIYIGLGLNSDLATDQHSS